MKKHRIFQWKSILKRVKMCEIVNCEINMMYITWNNVASVWECQKWRLKTNLFWETSKISMLFSPVSHCGTLYSKSLIQCTRPNTALWAPAARQLWSDGFRILINGFRRDLNGVWSGWFSDETFKNGLIILWFYFVNLRSKSLTKCNFGLHRETCSPEANHVELTLPAADRAGVSGTRTGTERGGASE